jgi:hypothetical protein
MPQRFHQPPITHVSRLVGSESLPLFFTDATFQLVLHPIQPSSAGRTSYAASWEPDMWMAAIPDALLGRITQLDITPPSISCRFHLDLKRVPRPTDNGRVTGFESLQAVIKEIGARVGAQRLQREGIMEFEQALEGIEEILVERSWAADL